jgi:chromosome segregation ATPase
VSTATELGAKDETIKSLQSQLAKLAAELAASKGQGEASRQEADATIRSLHSQLAKLAAESAASKGQEEASRQEADDLRSRVATAQAEATKANKGLEALKTEARAQAQTHARAHAQALEAHAEIVRKMKQDNTELNQQVFALRQDKAALESQVAHLRPLATKAVRKVASLSRETKKLKKEKESFLREKLILQQVEASVRLFLVLLLVLFWGYCCFGVIVIFGVI